MSKRLVGELHKCLVDPSKSTFKPSFNYLYVIDGYFIACDSYVFAKISMKNFNFTEQDIKNAEGVAINYETTKKLSQSKWKKIVFTEDGIEFYSKSFTEPEIICPYSFKRNGDSKSYKTKDGAAGILLYDYESIIPSDSKYGIGAPSFVVDPKLIEKISTLWKEDTAITIEVPENSGPMLRIKPVFKSSAGDLLETSDLVLIMTQSIK